MTRGHPKPSGARARRRNDVTGFALLAALLAAFPIPSVLGAGPPQEYAVKAAFLYNFAKFVEWPPEAFKDPASPLVLGILGTNPFGEALQSLKGKTVNGRPLAIRTAASLDGLGTCQILFISSSEVPFLPGILNSVKGQNVLTVGDVNEFCEAGGLVNLVTTGDRIGIEVNLEAVGRTRLKISSKILALARIVKSGPR